MPVDPIDHHPLQLLACTLSPGDGAARLDQWREIGSQVGLGRDVAPGQVKLRFRDEPGVGDALNRLVAAERECCGFLKWELTREGAAWCVEISGTDDGLRSLPIAL